MTKNKLEAIQGNMRTEIDWHTEKIIIYKGKDIICSISLEEGRRLQAILKHTVIGLIDSGYVFHNLFGDKIVFTKDDL